MKALKLFLWNVDASPFKKLLSFFWLAIVCYILQKHKIRSLGKTARMMSLSDNGEQVLIMCSAAQLMTA